MTSAVPTAAALEAYGLDPTWSRYVEVPSHDGATHRWHLLDRPGSGPTTVLCLHGNPTWSYLWSRLLRELDPAIRVIAPDHLGMGWSDRPGSRPYRDRVTDVHDLLVALDVTGPVWIVAQDWGGAIAMGVAVHHPEIVAGLVLSNTGIAVPAGRSAPWLIRLAARHGVHRLATRTTPTFVWGTPWLPGAFIGRRQRRALAAPYHGRARRDSIAGFVADVPFDDRHPSAPDIAAVAAALPDLAIPVRLVWGSKDPVFNDDFAEDLGIARPILTKRLQRLVAGGVMEKGLYQEHPPRYEYKLTPAGVALSPTLVALIRWGEQQLANGEHEILLVHSACGTELEQGFWCTTCETTFGPTAIRAVPPHHAPAPRDRTKP